MLRRLLGKHRQPEPTGRVIPIAGALPCLTARELLAPHQNALNKIKELAGVPDDYYHRLYETALINYAIFVQQLPASETHHHAVAGGMLQHGLEVAASALQLRRAHLLPPGATPETIAKKQDLWTYAVFTAALCHDLAKPAVDQEVTLYDADGHPWPWLPWTGPMATPARWYRTKFRHDRLHRLHEKASLLLLRHILPSEGFDWLSGDLELFAAWLACIGGDTEDTAPIGKIVSQADRESVARSLGAAPDTKQVQSPSKPLHEKLLSGLRHLLMQGELPLNRNGAAGWLVGNDLWLVSKRAIDTLRVHLLTEGHSGIPNRNDRIFDTLQERGILVPCGDRAIWRATVKGEGWEHELTLIRIPAGKIWTDPETRPEMFSGEVFPDAHGQVIAYSGADQPGTNDDGPRIEAKGSKVTMPDSNCSASLPACIDKSNTDSVVTANTTADDDGVLTQEKKTQPSERDDSGEHFLTWLRESVRNGKLTVDAPNARIRIIPEGAFLVSPAIFKEFVEKTGTESRWEQVQKRFLRLNVHAKTHDGLNVHKYKVNGIALNGIIVPELSTIGAQAKNSNTESSF